MSKNAKDRPVFTTTEVDIRDVGAPQSTSVIMPATGSAEDLQGTMGLATGVMDDEIQIDVGPLFDFKGPGGQVYQVTQRYLEDLKRAEDELTIVIAPTNEKNAEQLVPVFVGGVPHRILRGRPTKCKRKFVEVLARAKPVAVETNEFVERDGARAIRIDRTVGIQYPFSIIHDPHPAYGGPWLERIANED
jgi:hypothetical protein